MRNRESPGRTPGRKAGAEAVPDAAELLRLDHQLCFALYSTSLTMTRLYKPHLDRLGLTYPQYLAMLALWEQDGQSVGELGARLHLDSGTLTPLLKRMEASGWLERRRSRADERRVEILLTAAGRRLKPRAAGVPLALLAASGCSAGELRALSQQLQQLRQSVLDTLQPHSPDAAQAA